MASVPLRVRGKATWPELHSFALTYTGDRVQALAWLSAYDARVPTIGCSCRSHWLAWRRANPPDLTDADSFFTHTVRAHNAVSTRLGKPTYTPDEVRHLYVTPPSPGGVSR